MTPERWRQIENIYDKVQHGGPAERAALLECTDPEIRSVVERMLASDTSGQLLDGPAAGVLDNTASVEESANTVVATGAQFGPYKIEARIGSGGMGTVYRATDTRLGRQVAIKITAARYSQRFRMEALAISTLNHPHVCTLYDIGLNYMVMELIEGSTLAEEIRKGPLAPEKVARFGAQIASALAEAHARGIVHRDLKPANVMLTRHGVKVLDFGLARVLSGDGITETHMIMGTPAYMAPEQVEGLEPTDCTDLFALGLVLYEMSAGRLPFPGASLGRLLVNGSQSRAPALARDNPAVPPDLDVLVAKLLERDPASRYRSASQAADELSVLADRLTAPPARRSPLRRPLFFVPAILLVLMFLGIAGWLYRGVERRNWVREQAVPEIGRLASSTPLAAFMLLRKAQEYLPGDPQLLSLAGSLTRRVSVQSSPGAAAVEIQDYMAPEGPWLKLGDTPLKAVLVPQGYFRWKVTKPGVGQLLEGPVTSNEMSFDLKPPATPAGMGHVPAGVYGNFIGFIGSVKKNVFPAYDIDQFEVTNRQYQAFVDQGGYRKLEYWKNKFIQNGTEISWDQAMSLFRDPTGRAGPATWEGGHFPQGKADFPVSGVSWYEASAYAVFAGKSLPSLIQWYTAAPIDLARYSIDQSNFGGRGPWRVGTSQNVGPYGTYDMSGNVREWSLNATDSEARFILGGGWRTQTYQAFEPEALPPFDRSVMNGIRCVRNIEPLPAAAAAPIIREARDFSKVTPAPEAVFQAYRTMYAYDHNLLAAKKEGIVEDTADWTKEKITIDGGWANSRLPLYLFLPKNVRPPFQTVVFFPSARVNPMPSSKVLGDLQFVDYVIKSGRALVYPVYTGTYERSANRPLVGAIEDLNLIVQESKEVRRSVDYLETRSDIDASRLAYLGVSQGTGYGVIFAALEERFKTIVFLDGGFFLNSALPPRDQANFAPRITKPVLMVNGRYDFSFPVERSQDPLFRMLGTPDADKRHVIFDTPHDISQQKADLSKEVLAWLDKYLGRVN